MLGAVRGNRDKLISDILLWTSIHTDTPVVTDQQKLTSVSCVTTGLVGWILWHINLCSDHWMPFRRPNRDGWQERVKEICVISMTWWFITTTIITTTTITTAEPLPASLFVRIVVSIHLNNHSYLDLTFFNYYFLFHFWDSRILFYLLFVSFFFFFIQFFILPKIEREECFLTWNLLILDW